MGNAQMWPMTRFQQWIASGLLIGTFGVANLSVAELPAAERGESGVAQQPVMLAETRLFPPPLRTAMRPRASRHDGIGRRAAPTTNPFDAQAYRRQQVITPTQQRPIPLPPIEGVAGEMSYENRPAEELGAPANTVEQPHQTSFGDHQPTEMSNYDFGPAAPEPVLQGSGTLRVVERPPVVTRQISSTVAAPVSAGAQTATLRTSRMRPLPSVKRVTARPADDSRDINTRVRDNEDLGPNPIRSGAWNDVDPYQNPLR